jgi:hypothetical protein
MALYFHKIDNYFPCFFIIRSFGDEFRSIFGDILSYLSSNIGNEGKTFNSSCNTDHRRNNFESETVNDFIISYQVHGVIFCILLIPAMLFINYKLFLVVRKSRKNKRILPDMKKPFSLKNISSCLLVVACLVVVSIPLFVYIGLRINSPETTNTLDNANLAWMWAATISMMNCTFNCLIFYWKNKVLRTEGLKVLKSMKICRRLES